LVGGKQQVDAAKRARGCGDVLGQVYSQAKYQCSSGRSGVFVSDFAWFAGPAGCYKTAFDVIQIVADRVLTSGANAGRQVIV
jgi:hypothetical protein